MQVLENVPTFDTVVGSKLAEPFRLFSDLLTRKRGSYRATKFDRGSQPPKK